MSKAGIRECTINIHDCLKGELKAISGKWFYTGNNDQIELKGENELYRFLSNNEKKLKFNPYFEWVSDPNRFRAFIDVYIKLYGEPGDWLPMKIIEDSKKIYKGEKMAFPLNVKQLMIINYLLRHNEEKCIILTGVGGSGKSTFGNIIQQIFDNDVGHANLTELSNKFSLEAAVKHRLIYSDELNSDEMNNGVLKTLFSNQKIQVQAKGRDPYEIKCQSAFLFCCNTPPRIDLDDTGLLRRILYYSMNEKIKNPDPKMNNKVYSYDDLCMMVAYALHVPMNDWDKCFEAESRYNLIKNNSVFRFSKVENYGTYSDYCKQSGLKPYSEPKWETIRALILEWKKDAKIKLLEEQSNGIQEKNSVSSRYQGDELPY